ncbi:MAG: hypothetical protein KAH48_05010 [Chlorobi bacterium]|nr:hypothetical protein [Chlorobiota bacterium]
MIKYRKLNYKYRVLGLVLIGILSVVSHMNLFAHLNLIDVDESISSTEQYKFLVSNQGYYLNWSNSWEHDIPKDSIIKKLNNCYDNFKTYDSTNIEINLFLGVISSYLYNLEEHTYFAETEKYFKRAIKLSSEDYRGYWFLAIFYANAGVSLESIKYFKIAESKIPPNEHSAFWEEYAFATGIANMPSHCIYAMEKTKKILGYTGNYESALGETIRKRIVEISPDTSISKYDLWSPNFKDSVTFISRALGMEFTFDTTWNVTFSDYSNGQAYFIIEPPAIRNSKGKEIGFSMILFVKKSYDQTLDEYIHKFLKKHPRKIKLALSDKYENVLTYEDLDDTMYQDWGGGHFNVIGIEREFPAYPGKLFERPIPIPNDKGKDMKYYRASSSYNRLPGKLYYVLILDTCEDIYEDSFKIFKQQFESQIIIE